MRIPAVVNIQLGFHVPKFVLVLASVVNSSGYAGERRVDRGEGGGRGDKGEKESLLQLSIEKKTLRVRQAHMNS